MAALEPADVREVAVWFREHLGDGWDVRVVVKDYGRAASYGLFPPGDGLDHFVFTWGWMEDAWFSRPKPTLREVMEKSARLVGLVEGLK